jgi:hypothetical protein
MPNDHINASATSSSPTASNVQVAALPENSDAKKSESTETPTVEIPTYYATESIYDYRLGLGVLASTGASTDGKPTARASFSLLWNVEGKDKSPFTALNFGPTVAIGRTGLSGGDNHLSAGVSAIGPVYIGILAGAQGYISLDGKLGAQVALGGPLANVPLMLSVRADDVTNPVPVIEIGVAGLLTWGQVKQ